MPLPIPTELTTSDWVDALVGRSRDDQIALLATYHRRIEYAAKTHALTTLAPAPPPGATETAQVATADTATVDVTTDPATDPGLIVAQAVRAALAALEPPADYVP